MISFRLAFLSASLNLAANATIIVWGAGFNAEGSKSLRFTRAGANNQVVLDDSTGLYFWNNSPDQMNAALGGKLAPGQWTLTVKNGCGLTSTGFAVTIR
jgi:hypothetical protein